MPMPISLFRRAEGGAREDGSTLSMQERAGEGAAASPSIMPKASTPAPCCADRTKDEPKAAPEENGPENEDKAVVVRWWRPWPIPGTGELPTVFIHRGHVRHAYEDGTTRLVGIAAAPDVPNGPLAERMRAAPHPDPASKGVDIPDTLYRLVALDTNIAALVGWGLVPHLQDGELVIDGLDALDAESRAGLERWLAHDGPNGEPRRERVLRALRTGRKATC